MTSSLGQIVTGDLSGRHYFQVTQTHNLVKPIIDKTPSALSQVLAEVWKFLAGKWGRCGEAARSHVLEFNPGFQGGDSEKV